MATLTTVYVASLFFASIASFGGTFASYTPTMSANAVAAVSYPEPELNKLLQEKFPDAPADVLADFIKTPVSEWQKMGTAREITQKYVSTMQPDTCPADLGQLCNLVTTKYTAMRDYIMNQVPSELGDQTSEALQILQNNQTAEPEVSQELQ